MSKARKSEELFGLLYPVPTRLVNILFESRNIFVKYLAGKPDKIKAGMRFVIYASQGIGAVKGPTNIW